MIDIIVSDHALEETDVRLFPESRHRSQRIRKKLIKRFGGEFQKRPCIFKMGNKFFAHPAMYARLQQELAVRQRESYESAFYGSYNRLG